MISHFVDYPAEFSTAYQCSRAWSAACNIDIHRLFAYDDIFNYINIARAPTRRHHADAYSAISTPKQRKAAPVSPQKLFARSRCRDAQYARIALLSVAISISHAVTIRLLERSNTSSSHESTLTTWRARISRHALPADGREPSNSFKAGARRLGLLPQQHMRARRISAHHDDF